MKEKTIIIIIAVLIAAFAIWYFFFNGSRRSIVSSGTSTGSSGTSTGSSPANAAAKAKYVNWTPYASTGVAVEQLAADAKYEYWKAEWKRRGYPDIWNDGYNTVALWQCRWVEKLTNRQLQYLANKYNKGVIV
jgi:hypothetical protein